ncbi:MAG: FAD-dependent oxidoreductase [Opitutaceae bacterium]|nr:FAD-dependent oxidoreductase [Cytophagales bacterium]
MSKIIDFIVQPEVAFNNDAFLKFIDAQSYRLYSKPLPFKILRRSIDARSRDVKVNLSIQFFEENETVPSLNYSKPNSIHKHAQRVLIIGAGPAGLFAALKLLELGHKPILIERGKDVKSRRRDIAAINKDHIVNSDSNYCFGEGGAGTYSDGKLYTRSSKRGDINRILEILVAFGAKDEILIDAHPHIGTNKLPALIQNMREGIIEFGGEVHFEERVTDLDIQFGEIKGVKTLKGNHYQADGVILATGHSARDIYYLLHQKAILIEQKAFALGVRIEHQQQLIDKIQYKCEQRGEWLPAASYSLVSQENIGNQVKGVFSFCMCPGGFIVPSATEKGEVVVNGMSPSRRDSKYSNSGIVVQVDLSDTTKYKEFGPLAGLKFQEEIEKNACRIAGGSQNAPAQRLVDFVDNRVSGSLPETSYQPGMASVNMSHVLPEYIGEALKKGFKSFGRKMNGYFTNEAVILGVESRTSSPIRIPRDKETLEHVQIGRLFPCGEGAGYAGGIVSAAMDGEICAVKWVEKYA